MILPVFISFLCLSSSSINSIHRLYHNRSLSPLCILYRILTPKKGISFLSPELKLKNFTFYFSIYSRFFSQMHFGCRRKQQKIFTSLALKIVSVHCAAFWSLIVIKLRSKKYMRIQHQKFPQWINFNWNDFQPNKWYRELNVIQWYDFKHWI